jgi:hypothetical protein
MRNPLDTSSVAQNLDGGTVCLDGETVYSDGETVWRGVC